MLQNANLEASVSDVWKSGPRSPPGPFVLGCDLEKPADSHRRVPTVPRSWAIHFKTRFRLGMFL
jgi:hypothetical protein